MAPRVIFLVSDTGGGHRASAEAVEKAIELHYPGRFDIDTIDPFVEGSRPLVRWLVYRYNWVIKHMPRTYGLLFHGTDNRVMIKAAVRSFGRQLRPGINRSVGDDPPAAIVSFHPLTNHVTIEVLDKLGLNIPFVTVITDMTEVHRFWMTRRADIVVVPSMEARRLSISKGLDPRRVHVAGLPVNPRFTVPSMVTLRRRCDGASAWPTRRPCWWPAARVPGGWRRRPRRWTAPGWACSCWWSADANQKLQAQLEREKWKGKVHVYGFVDNMPELMQASDAIVTKAGPGTISEALISGLPIFLTGYVPGQEEGNVNFVIDQGVGYYTPPGASAGESHPTQFRRGPAGIRPHEKGHAEMVGHTDAASRLPS